jgi:hypothetical protein
VQLNRAKWLALSVIGGATVIVACSSSVSVDSSGGSFGRAGGVGPVGSTSGVVGATQPPRCPADAPTIASSCSGFASICTYGPDVRDECVEKYECERGRWQNATASCQVQCPKTFAEIVPGTACGDTEMACSYDEGTCGCFVDGPKPTFDAGNGDASTGLSDAGDGGAGEGGEAGGFVRPLFPGVWKCVAPPADPTCPSARPRVLDACVKEVVCDYGTCELGLDLGYSCTGGIWQPTNDLASCDP